MNRRTCLIALMALAAVLAACGVGPADSAQLDGTQWVLVTMAGEPPMAGREPSAEFAGDQVSGSASCNTYFGTYEVSGSEIRIGEVAQTEMWCPDPEGVMDQEKAFLVALTSVASYRLAGEQLELLDGAGAVVLTFESRPTTP